MDARSPEDVERYFSFHQGHETFPIYRNPHIIQILANAVLWAKQAHQSGWDLANWGRPGPLGVRGTETNLLQKTQKSHAR